MLLPLLLPVVLPLPLAGWRVHLLLWPRPRRLAEPKDCRPLVVFSCSFLGHGSRAFGWARLFLLGARAVALPRAEVSASLLLLSLLWLCLLLCILCAPLSSGRSCPRRLWATRWWGHYSLMLAPCGRGGRYVLIVVASVVRLPSSGAALPLPRHLAATPDRRTAPSRKKGVDEQLTVGAPLASR